MNAISPARAMALLHGAFYTVSALWALVAYRSFEAVTGPKREPWVVKTVASLLLVQGAVLLGAGTRPRPAPSLGVVAAGSAAALGTVDVVYASRGRVAPTYWLDALAELLLVLGWAGVALRTRPGQRREEATAEPA